MGSQKFGLPEIWATRNLGPENPRHARVGWKVALLGKISTIAITDEQAEGSERLLSSGFCAEPGDLVAAGLAALVEQERAWLRAAVLPVLKSIAGDPGQMRSSEQVFAEPRAHHAKRLAEG